MNEPLQADFLIYYDAITQVIGKENTPEMGGESSGPIGGLVSELQKLLEGQTGSTIQPAVIDRAMRLIRTDAAIYRQVMQRVWELEADDAAAYSDAEADTHLRGFEVLPGSSAPMPPGTRMVCPAQPGHYSRFLRTAGQKMMCPEHHCPLVPEA